MANRKLRHSKTSCSLPPVMALNISAHYVAMVCRVHVSSSGEGASKHRDSTGKPEKT
jgi:hypothetical protein